MSGMDLVEFLNARLDEDEQVAREATPGPWSVRPETRSAHSMLYGEADVYGPDGRAVASDRDGGCTSTGDAAHIARHDPARVLADVAAKRAILNYHTQVPAEGLVPNPGYGCQLCACDSLWYVQPEGYCPTVRALALPYADHPDYRQEWAL